MFLAQKIDETLLLSFGQLIEEGTIIIHIDKKLIMEYHFSNSDFEKIYLSEKMRSAKLEIKLIHNNQIDIRAIHT
jgi:hypothetical protein